MGFISLWKFFSYLKLMNVSLLKLFSWKMILEKSLRPPTSLMPRQDNSGTSSSKYLHIGSFNFGDTNNRRRFGDLVTEFKKNTKNQQPDMEISGLFWLCVNSMEKIFPVSGSNVERSAEDFVLYFRKGLKIGLERLDIVFGNGGKMGEVRRNR